MPADAGGYLCNELAAQPIGAEAKQDTRDVQDHVVHIGDPAEKILQRFNANDPAERPEKNRLKAITFRIRERVQYADGDKQQHIAREIQQRDRRPSRGIRAVLPKEPNRAQRDKIRRGAREHIALKYHSPLSVTPISIRGNTVCDTMPTTSIQNSIRLASRHSGARRPLRLTNKMRQGRYTTAVIAI